MRTESVPRIRRHRRYRRHRNRKPSFQIQERDVAIVTLVWRHRLIRSDDIQLLIGGSSQNVLRRLQKLFHHSYLDRPRAQRPLPNQKVVYALGTRGAILLAERGLAEKSSVDWAEKNRKVTFGFMDHTLMIGRLRVALECACARRSDVLIERWISDGEFHEPVQVIRDGRREDVAVRPDATFVLLLKNEPAGKNRVICFVEADRSTMPRRRMLAKYRAYWHFWRSDRPAAAVGADNFLVLTITKSAQRAAVLMDLVRRVDEKGRGLRMFLFSPETSYLTRMQAVLADMWSSAADTCSHSVLE